MLLFHNMNARLCSHMYFMSYMYLYESYVQCMLNFLDDQPYHLVLRILTKFPMLITTSHHICCSVLWDSIYTKPVLTFSKQHSTSLQQRPLGEHVNNETTLLLLTHHTFSSPWLCYREPATASSIVMAEAESPGTRTRWSGYHGPQKGFMPRSSGVALCALSSELGMEKQSRRPKVVAS